MKLGLQRASSLEAYFRNTLDPVLKHHFENNIKGNMMQSVDEGVKAVSNG
jgi:hypothetical protein